MPKLSEKFAEHFKLAQAPQQKSGAEADSELEDLQRQMKRRLAFVEKPADKYQSLVDDGTISRVTDAQIEGEELSLREVLYPKKAKRKDEETKVKAQIQRQNAIRDEPKTRKLVTQ